LTDLRQVFVGDLLAAMLKIPAKLMYDPVASTTWVITVAMAASAAPPPCFEISSPAFTASKYALGRSADWRCHRDAILDR
jgi:hypothetical protein